MKQAQGITEQLKAENALEWEDWKVFENTHEALIDRETWELVQTLRANKRRPNRTGEVSMFSGSLYCGDCGEKLYYSVTNNYSRERSRNTVVCIFSDTE